jgi:hypothetical protein
MPRHDLLEVLRLDVPVAAVVRDLQHVQHVDVEAAVL